MVDSTSHAKDYSMPINVFIKCNDYNLSTDEDIPFCLNKIMNKPILFYILEFLERHSFKEATLLTLPEFTFHINSAIPKYVGSIKTSVVLGKSENFEDLKIFEFIQKKVTRNNFILIKADSLLDFDLNSLIDSHLLNMNFASMVLLKSDRAVIEQRPKLTLHGKETQLFQNPENQVFGIEKQDHNKVAVTGIDYRKVYYSSIINEADDDESYFLKKELLVKSPGFQLDYSCQDIEFYVFNRLIFELLNLEPVKKLIMTDIRTQLIPFIINRANHRIIKKMLKNFKKQKTDISESGDSSKDSQQDTEGLRIYACMLSNEGYKLDMPSKVIGTIYEVQRPINEVPALFFSTENNAENIFIEHQSKIYENICANKNPAFELPEEIKMTSLDSYVAKPVKTTGTKCKITKSVVGQNLRMNEGSKIQLSLIGDNCVIGKE